MADEFGLKTIDALAVCAHIGLGEAHGGTVLTPAQVEQFRAAAYGQAPPSYGQAPPPGQPWGPAPGGGSGFPAPPPAMGPPAGLNHALTRANRTLLAGVAAVVLGILIPVVTGWIFFWPVIGGLVLVGRGFQERREANRRFRRGGYY